jgi:hypothetical protein
VINTCCSHDRSAKTLGPPTGLAWLLFRRSHLSRLSSRLSQPSLRRSPHRNGGSYTITYRRIYSEAMSKVRSHYDVPYDMRNHLWGLVLNTFRILVAGKVSPFAMIMNTRSEEMPSPESGNLHLSRIQRGYSSCVSPSMLLHSFPSSENGWHHRVTGAIQI